jgi:putative membrane protein
MKNVFLTTSGLVLAVFLLGPIGKAQAVIADPDAEVLSLIQTIDQHEIQAAQAAEKKQNIDSKVSDYAKMMEKEHTKNLDKDQKIAQKANIQVADTPAVTTQRSKGMDELTRLNALDGAQFAGAYIGAMIADHQEALTLLDSQSDKIQNQDLKKHVSETREHVEHHLKKAQQIQDQLAKPQ